MATLIIDGQRVTVSDEFTSLPPDEQQQMVATIYQQLQGAATPNTPNPAMAPESLAGVPASPPPPTPGPQPNPNPAPAPTDVGGLLRTAAQGTTLGFSDELGGVYDALTAREEGQSFGEAYRQGRDASRERLDAFKEANPKSAFAAEVAGGLLTGGVGAARAGASSLARLALAGGKTGAAYGAGASDADVLGGDVSGVVEDAAAGGLLGAAGGAAIPGAVGLLSRVRAKPTTAAPTRHTERVKQLENAGVKLTTGQKSGNTLVKARETTLSGTYEGQPLRDVFEQQSAQVQTKLLKLAGADDALAKAGVITDDVLDSLSRQLGNRYEKVLGDKQIVLGDDFVDQLSAIEQRHNQFVTPQQRREIRALLDDFLGEASKGAISAKRYQELRSLMGKRARESIRNNGPLAGLFTAFQKGLDDAFSTAVGDGSNKALNTQYAHYKQLEDVWRRAGSAAAAEGTLPLGAIYRASKKKGAPGSPEWKKFLSAAQAVLPDKLPNSGTAARLLTDSPGGFLRAGGRRLAAQGLAQGRAGGLLNAPARGKAALQQGLSPAARQAQPRLQVGAGAVGLGGLPAGAINQGLLVPGWEPAPGGLLR